MGSGNSKSEDGGSPYLLESLDEHSSGINCISISEDRSLLATGSEDSTIRMWTTKTPKTECLGVLKGHSSYITCLTICDTYIISGSADSTIRKWDMTTCECVTIFAGHASRVSRLICTGRVIFSTSYDKTAKAWEFAPTLKADDVEAGCFRTFEGHTNAVYSLVFVPATGALTDDSDPKKFNMGDILITGSTDWTARSWYAETGVTAKVFEGHTMPVVSIATDTEGKICYTASSDTTIRSWEIATGKCLIVMSGHTDPVLCMTIVNRMLYSGGGDGRARCWVREFGDCTRIYKGHKHSIQTIKYEEGILYTGSGDTTIRAMDAKSGVLKREFIGHEGGVSCMIIVGHKLYSGSLDSTLKVWDIKNIMDGSIQKYANDNGLEAD